LEIGEKNHEDPQIVASLVADLCLKKKNKRFRFPVGKGVRASLVLKNTVPWELWESFVLKRLVK